MRRQTLQRLCFAPGRGHHGRRVAGKATDARILWARAEQLLAVHGARRERRRLWPVQKAHEDAEHQPVRNFMQRVEEALIANIRGVETSDIVRLALDRGARWSLVRGLGKKVIRHAHFHVVGLAGKDRDGFVLRLPTEARDGAVVAAAIRNSLDAKLIADHSGCVVPTEDFTILNAVEDAKTKRL